MQALAIVKQLVIMSSRLPGMSDRSLKRRWNFIMAAARIKTSFSEQQQQQKM